MDTLSAAYRYEAILARAAAVSRGLGCLLLVRPAVTAGPDEVWLPVVAATAAVYSLVTGVVYWRAGRIRITMAATDVVAYAGLLCAGALAQSPVPGVKLSDHVITVALVAGIAPWSLRAALCAGTVLGLASLVSTLWLVTAPTWISNAPADAFNFFAVTAIAWVIARMLRDFARRVDDARLEAERRAGSIASQRQRDEITADLREQLLGTMRDLVTPGAVTDDRLREQLHADLEWLREHLAGPSRGQRAGLAESLRKLAAEKRRAGMDVTLRLPDVPPEPSPEHVEVLVAAAREALNNVGKHAGTPVASIAVRHDAAGLALVVADGGRGFEPATVTPGIGLDGSIRGRLSEAGGRATVDSRPSRGTVVTLWVPTTP